MTNSARLASNLAYLDSLDNPWKRLPIVAITALAAWVLLLTICGLMLGSMVPAAPDTSAIDAYIVMLPGAASGNEESGSVESRDAESLVSPRSAKAIAHARQAVSERIGAKYSEGPASHTNGDIRHDRLHEPHRETVTSAKSYQAEHKTNAGQQARQNHMAASMPDSSVKKKATIGASATNRAAGSAQAESSSGGLTQGAPRGSNVGNNGGGGSGPRPIYAPVPSIPDDMRDEVMQATAVVRFHIAADGTAKAALIIRTDYITLDQLILHTLRSWRFQPATRNGTAVDSNAEVRLRITVQ